MRTITITGKDRPELFRSTLQTLIRNDLSGWRIMVSIDPGPRQDAFLPICREMLGGAGGRAEYELWINQDVLGIGGNPHHVLQKAFSGGSALNLYLEEDLLLAPDATDLALWFQAHHRPGWLCLNLLCGPTGTAGYLSNAAHPGMLFETALFNSLGFVMRAEEWPLVSAAWFGRDRPAGREGAAFDWRYGWGWDWSVAARLLDRPELKVVQPAFARVRHNGAVGVYCRPDFHFRAFGRLPINGDRGHSFDLVDWNELPHAVRSHLAVFYERLEARVVLERAMNERVGQP